MLTDHAKGILINVLNIEGVQNTVINRLILESQNALDNPVMVKVAVNAALSNISPNYNSNSNNVKK